MLNIKKLKAMPPDTVFAQGEIENSPNGIYMTNEHPGRKLAWVAQRGGIHDWTIYIFWSDNGFDFCLSNGDKLMNKEYIQKLVPCDKEALGMYRY